MSAVLVNRETLQRQAESIAGNGNDRKFAFAMAALGLGSRDVERMPNPGKGRPRLLYPQESVWALAAMLRLPATALADMTDELKRFRVMWDELLSASSYPSDFQYADQYLASEDPDIGAMLLMAFGLEYGPSVESFALQIREHPEWLDLSSRGHAFMAGVVRSYYKTRGQWLADIETVLDSDPARHPYDFAFMFITALGEQLYA